MTKNWVNIQMMIDKTKPIPIYYQLKQLIIDQIQSKILLPGDKLPTEEWYSLTYEISRVTIRKALNELIAEGYLIRPRGQSPVVSQPKLDLNFLKGLFHELQGHGMVCNSKLLQFKAVPVPQDISVYLQIPSTQDVMKIQRIRFAENLKISLQTAWLIEKYCKNINKDQLETGSLYDQIESFGYRIGYAEQRIIAKLPSATECQHLEIDANTPVLFMERTTYLSDGTPFEHVKSSFISNRYNISMKVYR